VDSVNSGIDYFVYLCSPATETSFITKKRQLRINLTFGDRLQKPTEKMSPARWNMQLQGMHGLLLFYRV
jgi:hypothetical protein